MKKLNGTKFQISVWQEIKKIPKGQTKTYKDIALALKNQNHRELWQMHVEKILY